MSNLSNILGAARGLNSTQKASKRGKRDGTGTWLEDVILNKKRKHRKPLVTIDEDGDGVEAGQSEGDEEGEDEDDDTSEEDDSDDEMYATGEGQDGTNAAEELDDDDDERFTSSILPLDKGFSPSLFLTLVHGGSSFDDLRKGQKNIIKVCYQCTYTL